MSETHSIDRRSGFRFPSDDISVTVRKHNAEASQARELKSYDLSTIGIGIKSKSLPDSELVEIVFKAPKLLKGLSLRAKQRHVQTIQEAAKVKYLIGYEFHFDNAAQQDKLHCWTTETLSLRPASNRNKQDSSDEQEQFCVRFPQNEKEYRYCLSQAVPLRAHHALIQSRFFAAIAQKKVFAFMTYCPELSDFKLYEGTPHEAQLEPFRRRGLKIAEVSLPYFNEPLLTQGGIASFDLRKLRLIYTILPTYRNSLDCGFLRIRAKHPPRAPTILTCA